MEKWEIRMQRRQNKMALKYGKNNDALQQTEIKENNKKTGFKDIKEDYENRPNELTMSVNENKISNKNVSYNISF